VITPTKRATRPLIPILLAVLAGALLGGLPLPWLPCSLALLAASLIALARSERLLPALLFLTLTSLSAYRAANHLIQQPGIQGRWHAGPSYQDRTRGQLRPIGQRLSVPRGALEEGEEVHILAPHSWTRPVIGPFEPPAGLPTPTLHVTTDRIVRLRPPTLCARLLRPLDRARAAGLEALEGHPDPEARALLSALLFGERDKLDPAVTDLFTRTGTRHLLAISGFHIAILAVSLCGPLSMLISRALSLAIPRLRGRRILSPQLLRAALILTLIPLSGSGAPVLRAACAWSLASLAPLVPLRPNDTRDTRRPDALSAWCLALLIELLADPRAWQSVSVQLSYAATLGLILSARPLLRLFRSRASAASTGSALIDEHPSLATPLALLRRLCAVALSVVAASVVAVLATTPIVWHHFGELSPTGVLATPLAALLVTPLLLLGWLDLLLTPVLGAAPLHTLTAQLTQLLTLLLSLFDQLPATPTQLPPRPQWLIALACWTTLLAFRAHSTRRLLLCVASIAWLIILFPRDTEAKSLEVHALDVGHGTCVVFRAPGSRVWIFDAGSRDRSHLTSAALYPLLRSWGNPSLAFVCSHLDSDHARDFPRIASRYSPELWLGALPLGHESDCAHLDVGTGALHLSDGSLRLELHRGLEETGNEGSRTLVINYKTKRLVLSGDAEGDGLDLMLHQGELAGPTDLLLVPHHGSDSPWVSSLLERLQPAEVWVSCGGTPQLAEEFDRRSLNWMSTHSSGPLAWSTD